MNHLSPELKHCRTWGVSQRALVINACLGGPVQQGRGGPCFLAGRSMTRCRVGRGGPTRACRPKPFTLNVEFTASQSPGVKGGRLGALAYSGAGTALEVGVELSRAAELLSGRPGAVLANFKTQ